MRSCVGGGAGTGVCVGGGGTVHRLGKYERCWIICAATHKLSPCTPTMTSSTRLSVACCCCERCCTWPIPGGSPAPAAATPASALPAAVPALLPGRRGWGGVPACAPNTCTKRCVSAARSRMRSPCESGYGLLWGSSNRGRSSSPRRTLVGLVGLRLVSSSSPSGVQRMLNCSLHNSWR